ncbi:MAG: TonB-dependent receptor [Oligoflexus sp.]|nr:TonB-dependent receptor [Oligoflexus sp.]
MKKFIILLTGITCLPVLAEEAEKIEVIGKRFSIEPSSSTVIDAEQLDVFKPTDLNRLLKTVSGIQIQEEDGYGLRPNIGMRGAHPHRSRKILIMEDGIPSGPAPYAAPAAYYVPNMNLMDGIEVNKGSSAVRSGPQTIGGSINMITRSIPLVSLLSTIDIAAGSYGFKKAILSNGGSQGDWGWLLLVSDIGTEGFKSLNSGGKTGFHKQDFMGKLRYEITANQSFELKYGWSTEYSAETYLGISRSDFDQDAYQRYAASQRDNMKNKHGTLALKYQIKDDNTIQTITAYQNRFDRRWSKLNGFTDHTVDVRSVLLEPVGANQHAYEVIKGEDDSLGTTDVLEVGNNHRSFYSRGLDWQGKHTLKLSEHFVNEMDWGLRYHEDGIRRDHTLDSYNMLHSIMVESGAPTMTSTQNRNSSQSIAAFVWDTVTISDWSLSAGIRQEWVEYDNENLNAPFAKSQSKQRASMPGIGAFYRITPQIAWLAGAYRGIGLSAGDDGTGEHPEESINYESGFRWTHLKSDANIIGFWNDYKNIQGACSFSEGCAAADVDKVFNGGKAKVYGLEANLNYKFSIAKIKVPLNLQYTLTRASFEAEFTSALADWGVGQVQKGDPLPYISKNQATVGTGVEYERFDANLLWNWKGKSYDQAVAADRADIPAAYYLDASLRYHVLDNWQLYINADNVLKEKTIVSYRPFGARPGKPFTTMYGIKGSF